MDRHDGTSGQSAVAGEPHGWRAVVSAAGAAVAVQVYLEESLGYRSADTTSRWWYAGAENDRERVLTVSEQRADRAERKQLSRNDRAELFGDPESVHQ